MNNSIVNTNIDRGAAGNDLSLQYAIRYRLESDPDVDASYTDVTATKSFVGITIPFLDPETLDPETYVIHTYNIIDGNTTGTKITIDVIAPGA